MAARPGPAPQSSALRQLRPLSFAHDRADEDQHREAVDDLLVERGQHEAHGLGEAADVARVLDDAEEHRRGADPEELVPRRQVRAVEAEAAPAEQDDEDDLERQRRRDRHEAEVTDLDVAPRGDDVEDDGHRGDGDDGAVQRPARPAEPLPHERDARRGLVPPSSATTGGSLTTLRGSPDAGDSWRARLGRPPPTPPPAPVIPSGAPSVRARR